MFLVCSCGNKSYYEEIGIPAKKSRKGDYGIVGLNGQLIIDFIIDSKPSIMIDNIAHYKEDDNIYFINNKGETKETTYKKALHFNEGVALVELENGKLAFIDKTYKPVLILDNIEEAGILKEGLFKYKNEEDLWGFMDLKGNSVIKPTYKKSKSFHEGLALVEITEDEIKKIGFINTKGEVVIRFTSKYSSFGSFSHGFASYKKKDELGYINKNGSEVIKNNKWKEVLPFQNKYATVRGKDNEWGLIDSKGKYSIQTVEKFPIRFFNDLAINVNPTNKKGGYINEDRKQIIRGQYEEALPFFNSGAYAKDAGFWQYINTKGLVINDNTLELRYLYHEEFFKSILKENSAFDFEKTLTDTYVNIDGFCSNIFNSVNGGFFLDRKNTVNNLEIISGLINSNNEEEKTVLKTKLNNYSKTINSHSILNKHILFDNNLSFSVKFDFNKPIFKKLKEDKIINEESELKSSRLTIKTNGKARKRISELKTNILDYLIENNFTFNEDKNEYYNKNINASVKITIGKYSNLYIYTTYKN